MLVVMVAVYQASRLELLIKGLMLWVEGGTDWDGRVAGLPGSAWVQERRRGVPLVARERFVDAGIGEPEGEKEPGNGGLLRGMEKREEQGEHAKGQTEGCHMGWGQFG